MTLWQRLRQRVLGGVIQRSSMADTDADRRAETAPSPRRPLAYDSMLQQADEASPRFLVLSGCQSQMIAGFLEVLTLGRSEYHFLSLPKVANFQAEEWRRYKEDLDAADFIYTQKPKVADALRTMPAYRDKVRYFPVINCAAYHPDISYMRREGERLVGPMGDYHSVLATAAYFAGKSRLQAVACFEPDVYQQAGFTQKANSEKAAFFKRFAEHSIDLSQHLSAWERDGPWMRTLNHPVRRVVHDVVVQVLKRDDVAIENASPSRMDWVDDDLARSAEWPVYPGVMGEPLDDASLARERLLFKSPYKRAGRSLFMNLEQLVDYTYASLEGTRRDQVKLNSCDLDKAIDVVGQT